MPGRRVPRQSAERAVSQHAYRTFSGALDGASSLPAPVGIDASAFGNKDQSPTLYFYQDEFVMGSSSQTLPLTYLPIAHSEHVYLCPGGGTDGSYQQENLTWTRDAGKRDLQILTGMNTRVGDTIVIEYAYYEQATVKKCGSTYPTIVVPSSPTLTLNTAAGGFNYLPAPFGFVYVPSVTDPDNYWAPDAWHADYTVEPGATATTVSVGPPLAPGSSGSRQTAFPQGTYEVGSHNLHVYSGDYGPRWGEASYIKFSTYYSITGLSGVSSYRNFTVLGFDGEWSTPEHTYTLAFSLTHYSASQQWELTIFTERPTAHDEFIQVPLTSWNNYFPTSPGTHYASIEVDCLNKTITARFDDMLYSYTGPEVWPDPSVFVTEVTKKYYSAVSVIDIYAVDHYSFLPLDADVEICTDQLTVSTDAPYCS